MMLRRTLRIKDFPGDGTEKGIPLKLWDICWKVQYLFRCGIISQ